MLTERQITIQQRVLSTCVKVETFVKNTLFDDFTLSVILSWSPKRVHSRGGIYAKGPGINLALHKFNVPQCRHLEYPSFEKSPIIGTFYTKNTFNVLDALTLHEVAHAIQMFHYNKKNIRCQPHGPLFKHYYSMLRSRYLNDKLETFEEQQEIKKAYDNYRKTIGNVTVY